MRDSSALLDVGTAAAALRAPGLTTDDLVQICLAHPGLRLTAAGYPPAGPEFLNWLATAPEPEVAAAARARLAAGPPAQPVPQAQPAARPVRRGRRAGMLIGAGGLGMVALAVAFVLIVLPGLQAAGAEPGYAPDLRQRPGATAVAIDGEAEAGWPRGYVVGEVRPGLVVTKFADGDDVWPGAVITGVDVESAKVAWTHDVAELAGWAHRDDVWSSDDVDVVVGDGKVVVFVRAGDAEARLVVLDGESGRVLDQTDEESVIGWIVGVVDGTVVVLVEGDLRGRRVGELDQVAWTRPAGNLYFFAGAKAVLVVDNAWMATDGGYVSVVDGSPADFARETGRDGVHLQLLPGTETLVRVSLYDPGSHESRARVQGYDWERDEVSWKVENVTSMYGFGDDLVVVRAGWLEAYRIVGDTLDPRWSTRCEGCWIRFADEGGVAATDETGDLTFRSLREGEVLDSLNTHGDYWLFGKKVLYSVKDDALVAFDRTKPGHPMLWSLPVDLPIVSGGKLLITGPQHLGILGAGNDLRLFTRDN